MYRNLDIIHKNNKYKIKKQILNEGGLNNVMSYASNDESKPEPIPEKKKDPSPVKKKVVEKDP